MISLGPVMGGFGEENDSMMLRKENQVWKARIKMVGRPVVEKAGRILVG